MKRLFEAQKNLAGVDDPVSCLQGLFAFAPVGLQVFNAEGKSLMVNQAFQEFFGNAPPPEYNIFQDRFISQSDLLSPVKKAFSGESVALPACWHDAKSEGGIYSAPRRIAIKRTFFPIFDGEKRLKHVACVYEDITNETLYKDQLKIAEERFHRLFEADGMGAFISNLDGDITEANDAFLRMTGYTKGDLTAGLINWSQMTPAEYREMDDRGTRFLLETGSCPAFAKEYFRKDGTRVHLIVGAALIRVPTTEMICFCIDTTEFKKLESQFRHAQKMEAIGRFAGGIAHDFNNLLNVIILQAERAAEEIGSGTAFQAVTAIRNTAERATRLTKQILAFSSKQVIESKDMDLNMVIRDSEAVLRRIIGEHISLDIHLAILPQKIRGDLSQIEQTILNLLVNSRDAMPTGGHVHISTQTIRLSPELLDHRQLDLMPGSYVELTVSDSGCGIDKSLFPHIFEPFFTTKDKGKGTGLGLSTVYGIVKQAKGDIDVTSEVGLGTQFRLYFPVVDAKELHADAESDMAVESHLGNGENPVILFVEDEDDLREATTYRLKKRGYTVLTARNGLEALEFLKTKKISVDLIVTDVVMPEMTGPALIQDIKKTVWGEFVPVLYLSGYPAGELSQHGLDHQHSTHFLEKPFHALQLISKIDQILNGSKTESAKAAGFGND